MESLRQKQRREIVDEDANISKRVFAMTEAQVRAFNETVLPKKTRDIESEISIDKLIEGLNRILEQKQVSLETLLTSAGRKRSLKGDNLLAYNQLVSNGDVVALFNQIVRIYTVPGLSRASLESIKVKLQDLKPNIDAVDYGLGEIIQLFFEADIEDVRAIYDKQISRLVQTQAVYRTMKNQLSNNIYQPITVSDINVSAKEVISELSEDQRRDLQTNKVDDEIQDRSLLNLPIQLGQNKQRIEALEAELGFQIPEDLKQKFDELLPKQEEELVSDIRKRPKGQSVVELQKQYNDQKGQLEDEKIELQYIIPQLRARTKNYQIALNKQRAYIDSFPSAASSSGEYSSKLASEEAKFEQVKQEYNELLKEVVNLSKRQKQIVEDENQLRTWYEASLKKPLEKIRNFEVPRRLDDDFLFRKPRGRSRKRQESEEAPVPEDAEQKYGGMMYDDERNDVYKMKGL